MSVGYKTGKVFGEKKLNFENLSKDDIVKLDGKISEKNSEKSVKSEKFS